MNLFELFVKIGVDDQASKKISGLSSNLGNGLKTAAKVGAAAITAVTSATAAMTTALVNGVSKTAEYGDNIDKMSQKMGMSAQAYQEWDAVMQHSGTSMETMKAGMKTLANAVENGNEAFQRLGLTQEQIANMSQEDLFAATIEGLQNVENETERTYLAGQLLGKGATELGALLNTSAEETQAMRDRVHELGGVMSDDAVKAAARYQDSLQDMRTAFSGLSRNMTSEFLPAMATVMDGLGNLFSGNGGLGQIKEGINQFAVTLGEVLPKITEVGGQIMVALGDAIVANLPVLIDAAVSLIMTLANGLIEQLPTLVQSGLQIILALAKGIASNLPTLIPTIVDVVLEIVNTLIDNVDMLVDASIAIIVALAEGLIKSLPELVKAIPKIVTAIVNGFKSLMSQITGIGKSIVTAIGDGIKSLASSAFTWGKDLIDNFVSGIKSKISAVTSAVSGIASKIKSLIGFSEPEEGPLSNFHTYAPDMMQLFAKGIKDNEHLITDQIGKSFDFGTSIVDITKTTGTVSTDTALASEIKGLRNDVKNLKIYLSTGALVGGVTDGIDQALGQKTVANSRRRLATSYG